MTRERHDNHVIVRTGPIYGPDAGGQWDRRVRTLLASLERGERVVRSGNVFRTFVHVEDLASALAELLDSEWRGTLHLGPGGRESYWSFCRKMARRCRRFALRQGNRSEWMRCGSMRRTAPAWIRKRKKDGRRSV